MTIDVNYRAVSANDLDRFEAQVWPQLQQAIATQREVMADWDQRSQCQHPEDEDCPE